MDEPCKQEWSVRNTTIKTKKPQLVKWQQLAVQVHISWLTDPMTRHGEPHYLLIMREDESGTVNPSYFLPSKDEKQQVLNSLLVWDLCNSVCNMLSFFVCVCVCVRPRSTSVSLVRCIRPSAAFGCPTSVQETTQSKWEPRHWLVTAPGRTPWTSMWLNVRHTLSYILKLHRCFSNSAEMMLTVIIKVIQVFDPTGYENVLYAMIFVPITIILLICLLVAMLVVLNRKRCVFLFAVAQQLFHYSMPLYKTNGNKTLNIKNIRCRISCSRHKNTSTWVA